METASCSKEAALSFRHRRPSRTVLVGTFVPAATPGSVPLAWSLQSISLSSTWSWSSGKCDAFSEETERSGLTWVIAMRVADGGTTVQPSARSKKPTPGVSLSSKEDLHSLPELKPKDLVGIPWRTAFALQADGWYLRSDIVWDKRNAMPESVTDRPSKAHDYLFLLAKRKRYFYDHVAVMEPVTGTAHSRGNGVNPKARSLDLDDSSCQSRSPRQNESFSSSVANLVSLRNKRSVWTIPTQPYPEEHFATFPEELIRTPILAGTSEKGCCAHCGAPYRRILERQRHGDWHPNGDLKQLGINCNSKAKWSQDRPTVLRQAPGRKRCRCPSCRSRA